MVNICKSGLGSKNKLSDLNTGIHITYKSNNTDLLHTVTVHNSIVIPDYMLERANRVKYNNSALSISYDPIVVCKLVY